jgi:hypothetical protein
VWLFDGPSYGGHSTRADNNRDHQANCVRPLVVADLTDGNANVSYELALRHVVGKPVVQMVAKGQQIPFDVMDTRTISFDINEVGVEAAVAFSSSESSNHF